MADTESIAVPGGAAKVAGAFVKSHGEPVRAVVQNIGRAGARVVLVGADGALGDVLVADVVTGAALIEQVDGLEAATWDSATVNATKIGPEHRRRMAGPKLIRWANRPKQFRG